MIIISRLVFPANIPVAIGTRIANVPQEVPVETDRKIATANNTTGMKILAEAFLMGVLNLGMSIMGIDQNLQKVVKGLVLLAAVIFDVVSKRKSFIVK